MNIEKIKINEHYVWVDKDAEIKEGDWFFANQGIRKCIRVDNSTSCPFIEINSKGEEVGHFKTWKTKIIAASPELNLDILTYVEWLAEQKFPLIDESWCRTGDAHEENLQLLGHRRTYIKGYQTAEKELPTWDDVRKAIQMAKNGYIDFNQNNEPLFDFIHSEEQIIEQLKQEKKL